MRKVKPGRGAAAHSEEPEVASNVIAAEVENLRDSLGSQSEVAAILGVNRSSVTRWLYGKDSPDMENQEKITGIRYVVTRLSKTFKTETAIKWLHGTNAHLGNQRPIDLLRNGRLSEVIAAIEQTEAGSFA